MCLVGEELVCNIYANADGRLESNPGIFNVLLRPEIRVLYNGFSSGTGAPINTIQMYKTYTNPVRFTITPDPPDSSSLNHTIIVSAVNAWTTILRRNTTGRNQRAFLINSRIMLPDNSIDPNYPNVSTQVRFPIRNS